MQGQHTAHVSLRPTVLNEPVRPAVATGSADVSTEGADSSLHEGAGGLQGRQRRRRGLQGMGSSSSPSEGSQPAPPALNGSAAPSAAHSQRRIRLDQSDEIASVPLLPPHLAAGAHSQQDAFQTPHFSGEPLALHASGHAQQQLPSSDWARRHGSVGVSIERMSGTGEASSSTAAELTEDGDKAEGVLQIGSDGARIPLYGRSVESILQVVHAVHFTFPAIYIESRLAPVPLPFRSAQEHACIAV